MDWVYGSRDHGSLSVHDGLTTMEWCDRSEARNVLVIAQSKREREREEIVKVLANGVTWRQSCVDGHTTVLNNGSW
jgi:hypothetical protein